MKLKGSLFSILLWSAVSAFSQTPTYQEIKIKLNAKGEFDLSQIEFLRDELVKADIVLLGEPAHTPQFYNIKIQLVKYLHEQLGFDVLAFESGLYQMETTNADIKNGNDTKSAFESGLFPIWTSEEEFHTLYSYIDSLQSKNNRLDVTGFDCQISGYSASKRFISEFETAIQKQKLTVSKKTLQILQAQLENLETGKKGLSTDFTETSLQELRTLANVIQPVPSLSIYHQSLISWIGHFSDLYYNKIFEKSVNHTFDGGDSNVRDSLMALNMIYLYRELYPGKKIIGWGANLHFGNKVNLIKTESSRSGEFISMGHHLKQQLGEKIFCLAVTTDQNYPNTFEKDLATKNVDLAWIGNKNLQNKNFANCILERPSTGIWNEVVDGILYFNSSEPSAIAQHGSSFINGKITEAGSNEPVSFASISLTGTAVGTSSGIDGDFLLKIDSSQRDKTIKVSSIGYKSKQISVKSLLKNGAIKLVPETELLKEVIVKGKAPNAKEILKHAIEKIPVNYNQLPFNMEFYSCITTRDTTENHTYILESIFSSYYDGYFGAAKKNYKIIQKREGGDYFMKEKFHGMVQWPMWEVAANDVCTNQFGDNYLLASPENIDKINPELKGFQLFDGDTVFVIRYNYHATGEFYISAKDYAVLKHTTKGSGKGYSNRTEIIYKKHNGAYFPYAANGDYLHMYKVDGKKKYIRITNRTSLNHIETQNVMPFEHNQDLWFPKNVDFDKTYWDANHPKKG